MKRSIESECDIQKRIKSLTINGDIVNYLKFDCQCGISFNDTIKEFNKKYCIINFCIDTDDDELLDLVVNRWCGFRDCFKTTKCIWMKRISDNHSHRCYGYFKIRLECNFLPEKYYNTSKVFEDYNMMYS